jgi:hypothetical protein
MKKIAGVLGILLVAGAAVADNVFLDDFNRADSATVGNGWTEVGGDESISGNTLLFATGSASGREWVTQDASTFASPFTTTLENNPGLVTWSFHMQQSRSDPSGFDAGNYGAAMILAASSADLTLGTGYAIALGNSGSTDPLRLVRFNGGMDLNSNLSNIISGGDYGAEYLTVRVTYNPANDNWALYASGNASAFTGNPTTEANQIGSATADSTYTGTALGYMGALYNHSSGVSETARFDNVTVSVIPEPASAGFLAIAGLGFAFRRLRSRK